MNLGDSKLLYRVRYKEVIAEIFYSCSNLFCW